MIRVRAVAQFQVVMLGGIGQALDLVDALGRDLDRLDVLGAVFVSTHGGDVDRPAVGEIEDRVGYRRAADLPSAFPVRNDLGATGVDVHDHDVIGAQQRPATALGPGETVVGFAFRLHSESAILRKARRSAKDRGRGLRLRTVSGPIRVGRGDGMGLRGGLCSSSIWPPAARN